MKRMALFTAAMLLAALFVFTVPASAKVAAAEAAAPEGRVEPGSCPAEMPGTIPVTCGYLVVPEDYDQPDGRQVRLPFAHLHSPNPEPAPDPLIFTNGGPGFSSIYTAWLFAGSAILEQRDIIIFEQRGNRYAEPALVCDTSIWWQEGSDETPCLDSIRGMGIDLSQYTSPNIAADVVALRQALGLEQWNVYGSSYSTTVMLLVMELDPEGTRSAILQSVRLPYGSTPAHDAEHPLRSIRQLLDDCAADPDCATAYPDLETQFFDLFRRLNAEPLTVVLRDRDGEPFEVELNGDDFLRWAVIDSFYGPSFPPGRTAYLPLLISQMAEGNNKPLQGWAQYYWNRMVDQPEWALGLLMSVVCQEELPLAGPPSAAQLAAAEALDGFARNEGSREVCAAWNLPATPPPASGPIVSDVPALILAGSYDPVTPPEWGQAAAAALPNSQYVEFAGAGHDLTDGNPCAGDLQAAFLDDPLPPLDTACVARAPQPTFILPEDVYIAPGVYNSFNEVEFSNADRGIPWLEAVSSVSLLILAAAAIILLGASVVWLIRRSPSQPPLPASAVVAAALAVLAIVGAWIVPVCLSLSNQNSDWLTQSFGAARDYLPATIMAVGCPLGLIFAAALAGLTAWAWARRRWRPAFRLMMTVVVLALVVIGAISVHWDLVAMLL